jgi:hypothetical protein
MQKEDNYNDGNYVDDYDEYIESNDDDSCPFVDELIDFIDFKVSTSFLGLPWKREDIIIKFLKERGYKIIERVNKDKQKYNIAVKPSDSELPEFSNIRSTFLEEAENLIIDMMIKFSKNNGK